MAAYYSASQTALVTIHLFKGNHFTKVERESTALSLQASFLNQTDTNLNYEVTIKPLMCTVSSSEITFS